MANLRKIIRNGVIVAGLGSMIYCAGRSIKDGFEMDNPKYNVVIDYTKIAKQIEIIGKDSHPTAIAYTEHLRTKLDNWRLSPGFYNLYNDYYEKKARHLPLVAGAMASLCFTTAVAVIPIVAGTNKKRKQMR